MVQSLSFNYNAVEKFKYSDGHYHLLIPLFFSVKNYSNHRADFLFDTGAYLTVITRRTAVLFEFDKIRPVKEDISLNGFVGSCTGSLIEIPGMVLGGHRLTNVRVAVPHVDTKVNILGLNVLEHFNYLIDGENSLIYFSENKNYKLPIELACRDIFIQDNESNG